MALGLTPDQLAQIDQALYRGEKITAIKTYRLITRCELIDAKQFVDARYNELKRLDPTRMQREAKGCVSVLIFLAILGSGSLLFPMLSRLFS